VDLNIKMTEEKQIIDENFDISPDNTQTIQGAKSNKKPKKSPVLSNGVLFPIWLSVSESAKVGGVTTKTIRRALQGQKLTYKIVKNRYLIDLGSVIKYLFTKKKLLNKLIQNGIGQYIDKWRE
jgi:hypothetical protein